MLRQRSQTPELPGACYTRVLRRSSAKRDGVRRAHAAPAAAREPRHAALSSSLNIPIAIILTPFADYDSDWLVQNSTTHCSAQKRSFPPSLEMKAQCPPYLGAMSAMKGSLQFPNCGTRRWERTDRPGLRRPASARGFALSRATHSLDDNNRTRPGSPIPVP